MANEKLDPPRAERWAAWAKLSRRGRWQCVVRSAESRDAALERANRITLGRAVEVAVVRAGLGPDGKPL